MTHWLNGVAARLAQPKILAMVFLLCALPTGLGCALLTPVGLFADEVFHAARADGLAHGEMFGQPPPPGFAPFTVNVGVKIDNGILAVLFAREDVDAFPDRKLPAADRRNAEAMPWFAGMAYYPTQMVAYAPVMYLPAALGLAAGKGFGLTPLHSFFLGRVAMLLCYVALGTAAVAVARFGQGLLFALLSLPASVDLAASYNQDGLIFGCCALVAALLTRSRAGPGRGWLAALAVCAAVLCAKPSYAALLLVFLAPLMGERRRLWQRLGWVALACVPPGLWLLHLRHGGFVDYQVPPYHPGVLWPGPRGSLLHDVVPANNMRVLLAHPGEILRLPLVSLGPQWAGNWQLLLGRISFDNSHIAGWEYPLLAVAVVAAAVGAALGGAGGWRAGDAGLVAVAVFFAFIGLEISLYLTATAAGMATIEGVQTRYFAPLLPFTVFLLPWAGRGVAGWANMPLAAGWLISPAVLMAAVNGFALPEYIYHVFQMPGP
jgi:hypothetical protein